MLSYLFSQLIKKVQIKDAEKNKDKKKMNENKSDGNVNKGYNNNNDEDEIAIYKIQPKPLRIFKPITHQWQIQMANQLCIPIHKLHDPSYSNFHIFSREGKKKKRSLLTQPAILQRMCPDGNCFFRYV